MPEMGVEEMEENGLVIGRAEERKSRSDSRRSHKRRAGKAE